MSGNAHIAARDGQWIVRAPVKLVSHGGVERAMSALYFPTLDAARDYCGCCDYAYSLLAPSLDLKPPPGAA